MSANLKKDAITNSELFNHLFGKYEQDKENAQS